MYKLFALPLMLVLGVRTFSKVSNYPYLLLGNFVLSVLTRFVSNNMLFSVGPIAVFHNDITIFFLLASMFAHIGEFTLKNKKINIIIFASLFSILFSFVLGYITYGFNTWLIYDIRKFLYHIILILFATTCDVKINIASIKKWVKRIAYGLVVYIYIGTAIHYVFGMQLGLYTDERPLPSHYAISLVIYVLYEVYEQLYKKKKPSISLSTMFAIIAIVINRYNTTWVALLGGIIVLIIMLPEKKKLLNTRFFSQVFYSISILIIIYILFADSSFMSAVFETGDKFNNMSSRDSTFSTRVELWIAMLSTLNERTVFIGLPMGSGYAVNYRGVTWQFNPHNGYVETIMRTGIIGCVLLSLCYVCGIISSIKGKHYFSVAAIVAMAIYFVAYTYEFELSFILGFILSEGMRKNILIEEKYGYS